jgi:hypothetical protein
MPGSAHERPIGAPAGPHPTTDPYGGFNLAS